jgi:hypothetical protein
MVVAPGAEAAAQRNRQIPTMSVVGNDRTVEVRLMVELITGLPIHGKSSDVEEKTASEGMAFVLHCIIGVVIGADADKFEGAPAAS